MKPNWEAFFQFSDDLLCIIDKEGKLIEVNPRFSDLLGWSKEELIGHFKLDFLHPEDQKTSAEILSRLFAGQSIPRFTSRLQSKSGDYVALCWNGVVIQDGPDKFVYASARDVTRELELAQDLKVKTLFLEQTSRVAGIGGWEVDLQKKTGKFTAETHRIYGTDPDSFEPNISKSIDAYIPEHRPLIAAAFQNLIETGEPYELELQIINTQGEQIWVRTIGEAQFEQGRIIRAHGTMQNINQEKALFDTRQREHNKLEELEQEVSKQLQFLSNLMDLAPVGIYRTNDKGECTFVNKAWSGLTSLSFDEAKDFGWINALHPEDQYKIKKAWQEFSNGKKPFELEYRFLQKNGSVKWVKGEAIPIRTPEGKLVEYLGSVVDMSEQHRILGELEKASKAKSMFLANVSHEIRTPLNAIIGFSQILAESETIQKTPYQEDILSIKRSSELLLAIINDVLDLSKIEAGNIRIEQRHFRIHDAIMHVVDMMKPAAEKKGIHFQVILDPNLPPWVVGDELRIKQILINFTNNAVKFTDEGQITVRIDAEHEPEPQQPRHCRIKISVEDTGIGITQEQMERIFQPFSQADSSTTRRFGGTGLGLAISKRLCELMGGSIQVESRLNQGSRFIASFRLPIGLQETDISQSARKTVNLDNFSFLRTLIVEDDPLNRKVALAALKKYGIVASTCNNGLEALQECRNQSFDLILMDVQMPVMGGYESTIHIRKEGKSQKAWILSMTANAFDEDRRLCLEAGMDDFMSKPIDFKQLQFTLAKAAEFVLLRRSAA